MTLSTTLATGGIMDGITVMDMVTVLTTVGDGECTTTPGDMATVMLELDIGVMAMVTTGATTEITTTMAIPEMWLTATVVEILQWIITVEHPEAVI